MRKRWLAHLLAVGLFVLSSCRGQEQAGSDRTGPSARSAVKMETGGSLETVPQQENNHRCQTVTFPSRSPPPRKSHLLTNQGP
jgi:hypothetical protein